MDTFKLLITFVLCSLAGALFDHLWTGTIIGIVLGVAAGIIELTKNMESLEQPTPVVTTEQRVLTAAARATFDDGTVVKGEIIYDRHAA